MKTPVFPHTVAFVILGLITPLPAQNLMSFPSSSEAGVRPQAGQPRFTEVGALLGGDEVPAIEKAQGELPAEPAVFNSQDATTLNEKGNSPRNVDAIVDLDVLRKPSPYRKVMVSTQGSPYEASADSLQAGLARISAVYRESGKHEKSSDCLTVALSVEQRVKLDSSKVLEIVELEVGANPGCACEIVKTAISASEADANQVVAIVEAAIHASPESMRIVSQCAIAAMPEAVAGVQALLAKLDPNAGETGYSSKSAKSAKSAKVASIVAPPLPNPLDRIYIDPIPPIPPPPPPPPPVTSVDPCGPTF